MKLSNKRILLTGATGGIGKELARQLAELGASLTLVGRQQDGLMTLRNALPMKQDGQRHRFVVADLNVKQDREKILQDSDYIDILINLAGVNQLSMLTQMSDSQVVQIITSNLTMPMLLCKDFLACLKSRPEAAIVNVGSILGSIGMAGSSVYCASKFGLRGFTEALRRELADTEIDVIYIAPRVTETAMNDEKAVALNTDLGNGVDSPQLVASHIVKALHKQTLNSYLGWPEKLFVRINALLPKLVDGSLKKQLAIIQNHVAP